MTSTRTLSARVLRLTPPHLRVRNLAHAIVRGGNVAQNLQGLDVDAQRSVLVVATAAIEGGYAGGGAAEFAACANYDARFDDPRVIAPTSYPLLAELRARLSALPPGRAQHDPRFE